MSHSKITIIGKIVKKIFGIKNFSQFRKKYKKKLGKLIYKKKYYTADLISIMCDMGMKKGSVVCIHCSMKEFYNYLGTAEELIRGVINVITEEGTLIMPCFPCKNLVRKDNYVFSLNDPTGAGYLAECFRKFPNVKRSINVQHSVAVWGKNAEWFVADHHKGVDCWDKMSPWYRLIEKDAIVFNFGLEESYIGTFEHCTESFLKEYHPYWSQFFTKEDIYEYYDSNNNVQSYKMLSIDTERRHSRSYALKHFDVNERKTFKLSNLLITVYYSNRCFKKMIELGKKGISPYMIPSTSKYQF